MLNDVGRTEVIDCTALARCSIGLLPRTYGATSSSPSESGTCRKLVCFDTGLLLAPLLRAGGASRFGGGAKRRTVVLCVSFSYSTDVLLGTLVAEVRDPEAHALLELERFGREECCMLWSAARTNALAMLTVVSFTLHRSGFAVVVVVVVVARFWSRCLRRAYLAKAGSSSCEWVDEAGFGGEREPAEGALQRRKTR